MNNIQGQAARKAHKAQHCWRLAKKSKLKNNNIYMCTCSAGIHKLIHNLQVNVDGVLK